MIDTPPVDYYKGITVGCGNVTKGCDMVPKSGMCVSYVNDLLSCYETG